MESTYRGSALELTIYGESHSPTIGVYIKGLPSDVAPDQEFTAKLMARRAPGNNKWSTPRSEKDEVHFEDKDGALHGYIINSNTKPKDYASIMNKPRPGHADYTGKIKFKEQAAQSGGGIFSGRMTAPMCIAGSIALNELNKMGVSSHAHLKECAGVKGAGVANIATFGISNNKLVWIMLAYILHGFLKGNPSFYAVCLIES